MSLFSNDATEFIDRIKNIDKSGITELTSEVESLTRAMADYEKVFNQATENGVALTKKQRNAWKEYTADINNAKTAQEALRSVTEATWNARKSTRDKSEIKELQEKFELYKKLQSALETYQQKAVSTSKAGENVHNDRALDKYRKTIDVGNEQPKGEVLPQKQVKEQADSLVSTVKSTYSEIQSVASQPIQAISLVDAIKQAKGELAKLQSEASKHKTFNPQTKDYDLDPEYSKKLDEAKEKLKALEDIKANWSSIKSDTSSTEQLKAEEEQVKKTEAEYERLNTEKSAQNQDTSRLGQAMGEADTSWITQEKMSLEELKNTYKELLEEKKSIESQKSVSQMSDSELKDYAQVLASMNRISEMIYGAKREDNAPMAQGGTQTQGQTEDSVTTLEDLHNRILAIKEELQEIRSGVKESGIFDNEDVEKVKALEAELKKLEATKNAIEGKQPKGVKEEEQQQEQKQMNLLDLLKETIATKAKLAGETTALPFSSDMEGAQANIQALSSRMKELKGIWSSMGSSPVISALSTIGSLAKNTGVAVVSGLDKGFKSAISGAKSLATSIFSLASGAFNALKSAVSTTLGNMKRLVSGGFNAVKNGVNAAKTGFQKLKSTMTSIIKKSTPNMMKSFSSLKSMLMRRIKRTFISSIFNQAKEGLQQLAKHSESFNTSMSNIKNSAKQAAGNLSVTLGSLISTIEPTLTTLINWFSTLLTYINSVISLLSGKNTVTVAKQQTDDYAKSLSDASSSAKDLNKQLYGFDELTRQEDSSSSSSSSKITYEEQEISSSLTGLFDKIKSAFLNGDYEEVGSLIAEKLNSITTTINNWITSFRSTATKWTANITEILNGFVESFDFNLLGDTIGEGFNLVFDVANTFLETFNWDTLGSQLASGINGIFDAIDWDLIGETVANYFNATWELLGNLFKDLDWSGIGYDLSISVMSIFENIDWESYKLMWSEGINGVFELLYTFFDGIDLGKIASDIDTNLTDLVSNKIDWNLIANAISEGVGQLQDAFSVIANSTFFTNLASKLGTTFGTVLNNIDWDKLIADIAIGVANMRSAFWELIISIDFPQLSTKIANGINGLLTNSNVSKSWDDSFAKATEGINNIIKAFSNLVDPQNGIDFGGIGTKIGVGVGDFLKDVDWDTLCSSIGLGISGLIEAFGKLLSGLDLPGVATSIASGINSLFDPEKGGATFEQAISAVSDGINGLIDGFATLLDPEKGIKFTQITSTLANSINGLIHKTDWSKLISTLFELYIDIQQAFWDIISAIDFADIGQKLADGINGIFTDKDGNFDSAKFESLGQSIGDGIKGILEGLSTFIEGLDVDAMLQGIFTFIESIPWTDIIVKAITIIAQTLIKAVDALPDLVQGIIDLIGKIDWLEIGKAIVSGIAGILGSAVEAVGGIITTIWNAIFGGGEGEEVEVPQILSDNVMNQLRAQMGEAGKELAGALNNALVENIGDAGSDYEAAKQLFLNSAAMLGLGYQEEFEKSMQEWNVSDATTASLAQQAQAVFEACKAPDATVQSIKEQFKQSGIWITDGLAEALIGQGSENIAMALQLMALGVDQETIAALDMSNLNENITAYMNETRTDITTIAGALGADVGEEIGDKIPEAVKNALMKGKDEVASTAQEVQQAADTSETQEEAGKNAAETGELVTEKLSKNLDSEEPAEKAGKTTKAVKEKYEALPDDVKPYAEQLMEYIVTALSDKDGTVQAAIEAVAQGAVDRAKEILNGETGIEIATTFLNGIRDGINADTAKSDSVQNLIATKAGEAVTNAGDRLSKDNGISVGEMFVEGISSGFDNVDIESKIGGIADRAVNEADNNMTYSNGYTVGRNMIVGMYNGFASYGQTLVDFIADVCNTCADTARDILGIASPSKVFAEIGSYTMEGMQIGLEDTGRDAIGTVGDIASAISEAGEDASIGNVMGYGLDTVITKLERVTNIFSDMADIIASMGGLEIPTIASGRTIPYAMQIEQSKFGSSQQIDETSLENAFYGALRRVSGTSDNEQEVNITLQIDGRKMADIVSKYQRQQSRAWGV